MPARIRHLTFDCRDPDALARFWAEVLGFTPEPPEPDGDDASEALITDPIGHHPGLLFIAVPEAKVVKNRLHLDLRPTESRDDTVERLLALGATVVDDRRTPDGAGLGRDGGPGGQRAVRRALGGRTDRRARAGLRRRAGHAADPRRRRAHDAHRHVGLAPGGRAAEGRRGQPRARRGPAAAFLDVHRRTGQAPRPGRGLLVHPPVRRPARARAVGGRRLGRRSRLGVPLGRSRSRSPIRSPLYEAACARSRAIAAEHGLDDIGADTGRREFTLRFALLHLVEETARHLGHLDILREHLDGTTGE